MNIIPGAAYLSPGEGTLFSCHAPGLLHAWDEKGFFTIKAEEAPADLVLLYAPGDDVEPFGNSVGERRYQGVEISREVWNV